jgi:hypothetical protein
MQDATVQSIPQTSPQPAVAPSNYVAAAPAAPAAPTQVAPTQVGTYYPQAVPQAAPQGLTSYQQSPSVSAPQSQVSAAPQGNPWESAFNKVVNLLGSPVQSPFQGQPSQPTPQYSPANYGATQAPAQISAPSAQPTWQTSQTSSPSSSQTSSINSLEDVANLLEWSPESRMVVANYGTEAPAILNQYALNLEGMLDSAVAWGKTATNTLKGYANFAVREHQENLAYNEILTNPDVLSDYTLKYFGPEGPYPVYESEQELETRGYPTAPVQQQQGMNVAGLPAPPAAEAPQAPQDFWGAFKQQMDVDPSQAWRIMNQADPRVMANKLFVME